MTNILTSGSFAPDSLALVFFRSGHCRGEESSFVWSIFENIVFGAWAGLKSAAFLLKSCIELIYKNRIARVPKWITTK